MWGHCGDYTFEFIPGITGVYLRVYLRSLEIILLSYSWYHLSFTWEYTWGHLRLYFWVYPWYHWSLLESILEVTWDYTWIFSWYHWSLLESILESILEVTWDDTWVFSWYHWSFSWEYILEVTWDFLLSLLLRDNLWVLEVAWNYLWGYLRSLGIIPEDLQWVLWAPCEFFFYWEIWGSAPWQKTVKKLYMII